MKSQIQQQINDVSYDFKNKIDQVRMTADEREELLNYWLYLVEVAEELNDKQ